MPSKEKVIRTIATFGYILCKVFITNEKKKGKCRGTTGKRARRKRKRKQEDEKGRKV